MILFQPCHVEPILTGLKTQTRRVWKKPRARIGSIHQAKTRMRSKDYFANIKILAVYMQRLGDMTEQDARDEGGYTLEGYRKIWKKINGHYDPAAVVYVVKFGLFSVPPARSPETTRQDRKLDTDSVQSILEISGDINKVEGQKYRHDSVHTDENKTHIN